MEKSRNMVLWNKFKQPPPEVLKTITGVRGMQGMTDINPQWRIQALTEEFGQCGVGWKYEIDDLWNVDGSEGQVMCFAKILLYTVQSLKENENSEYWSQPIPGVGGSMLITKESAGLHTCDEGYKMAITDALSVACKALGIGADVYLGKMDGETPKSDSKYSSKPSSEKIPDCETCGNNKKVIVSKYDGPKYYCLACKGKFNIEEEAQNNQEQVIQVNGDLLEAALDKMQKTKEIPALMQIWNDNKTLHKNKEFKAQFDSIKSNIETEA